MISRMVLLAVPIAAILTVMYFHLIYRYSRTKDKGSLYFGIAFFFLVIAAVSGALTGVAIALNHLPPATVFYQASTTSGLSAYLLFNFFAVAITKPHKKTRGLWIAFATFLATIFIIWAFNPIPVVIGGTIEFTLTSMYKAPYGLPLTETMVALMILMALYPTYLFFHSVIVTEERIVKIKCLLMGTGLFIGTIAYAIAITGAVLYPYVPIYQLIVYVQAFVGLLMMSFAYMMPKQIERILVGRAAESEKLVKSFVEEFFVYRVTPTTRIQLHVFSKNLGLNHQQMVGRRILLEFDPASHYEEVIRDFATEALANVEPIVVFTRRGSTIHSSLSENKAVKLFYLTQQVSVPKELSESEMLLPSSDTSLMLDVFDKMLKAHPESAINIVFDSLSDLLLSIGFEKTYHFMRYTTEMLESPRITALFLLNQTAHDPTVTSSLRELFSNQISFGKKGIQTVRLPKAEVGKVETENISSKKGG